MSHLLEKMGKVQEAFDMMLKVSLEPSICLFEAVSAQAINQVAGPVLFLVKTTKALDLVRSTFYC